MSRQFPIPKRSIVRLATVVVVSSCAAVESPAAAPSTNSSADDVHQCVLLLESAPLLMRFQVTIAGESLEAAREKYVERLAALIDVDGDDRLSPQEADASPLLRRIESPRAAEFLESLRVRRSTSIDALSRTVKRVAGETVVYRQDDSASERDSYFFELLDEDESGVIDRDEMASAAARLAALDKDRDQCVGYDELQPPADESSTDAAQNASVDPPSPPRAMFSELMRDLREPLLPRRMLRKYDGDNNGRLSMDELNWPAERVAVIDGNGDGALSANELRRLFEVAVDLDLAIELQPDEPGKPLLSVDGVAASALALELPSLVRLQLPGATVAASYRHVDPIPEAIAAARRRFNRLDVDASGYLDAEEIEPDVRMRRGLFDLMDANSDGKLFGEEVERYVRLRGEPAALTCRVCVYDTGSGFFQALDHNNDGRLSEREMRVMERSLRDLERDEREGVTLEEPARRFHIEFVRGGYQLFGSTASNVGRLPAFNRGFRPGPVWFRRMDRNNDGDLTWLEFLGHREDFHQLDADGDGLIDPSEAARLGGDASN